MIAPMTQILTILLGINLFAVAGVLLAGVFGMARGGEFNRKQSNRMMRLRVGLQGLAVVLFLLLMFTSGRS